jgi:hypothetical protein
VKALRIKAWSAGWFFFGVLVASLVTCHASAQGPCPFKDGDTDAMMEAREAWMSLQAGKDEMRHWFGDSADELKRQPLSVLIKYPQTVAKREGKLQKGALVE